MKVSSHSFWTNKSIRLLLTDDPIAHITSEASEIALRAIQEGWKGPPFDPTKLAEYLGILLTPSEDVVDARTVPASNNRLQIEFNPNKPRDRVRFSIAHEIAHSLFPDCRETIRHRHPASNQKGDEWQVEMLCNLGAAEFLMPIASFPDLKKTVISIDRILELRRQFQVSTEAVLRRVVRQTETPCAMFAASIGRLKTTPDRYRLDYTAGSRHWRLPVASGSSLPKGTVVSQCTAIGYTAKGDENWSNTAPNIHIQCVGIPPFPGETFPRVVGLALPQVQTQAERMGITFLIGDATNPRPDGRRIIAHIVNDKTPNWGAGFALAVRRKWPVVQSAFQHWANSNAGALTLGNVCYSAVDAQTAVFQMICQRGYGSSPALRLRYAALKKCLEQLADFAEQTHGTVHMPRIGAGFAGGSWGLIEQLIDEVLCARGIGVTVYDLPDASRKQDPQRGLFDE